MIARVSVIDLTSDEPPTVEQEIIDSDTPTKIYSGGIELAPEEEAANGGKDEDVPEEVVNNMIAAPPPFEVDALKLKGSVFQPVSA